MLTQPIAQRISYPEVTLEYSAYFDAPCAEITKQPIEPEAVKELENRLDSFREYWRIASFYIVYIAPALLAEILVDGALVAGLYRRMKAIEQRHWLRAAVRQTLLPALLVALFFTVAGYALQKAIPEAHTMGEIWNHIMRS